VARYFDHAINCQTAHLAGGGLPALPDLLIKMFDLPSLRRGFETKGDGVEVRF
jgi:hypothetical protein